MKKVLSIALLCIVLVASFIYFDELQSGAPSQVQRDKSEIPLQLKKLQSDNNRFRVNAVIALGEIGTPAKHTAPSIIDAMIKDVYGSPNHPYYAEALHRIGYDAANGLIKSLVNNEYPKYKYLATVLRLGYPDKIAAVVPKLIKLFKGEINDIPFQVNTKNIQRYSAPILASFGKPFEGEVAPIFIKELKSSNLLIRRVSAKELARMKPDIAKEAIPTLINMLQEKEYYIRHEALLSIENIGPYAKEAIPVLTKTMNDEDAGVASFAKRVLDKVGPVITQSPEELFQDYKSKDPQLSYKMKNVFRKLGPASNGMVEYLVNILKKEDTGDHDNAISAIGSIGPSAKLAIPVLISFLKSKDYKIRFNSIEALDWMGTEAEEALPALTEALIHDQEKYTRFAAARAIGSIGANAVPTLIKLLANKDSFVRANAAQAFFTIPYLASKSAIPSLREALKDKDEEVRIQAAISLGVIGWEENEAIPILGRVLNAPIPKDHPIKPRRMGAFLALQRIGTAEALKHIKHFEALAEQERSKTNN